jgi:hypothetical protein
MGFAAANRLSRSQLSSRRAERGRTPERTAIGAMHQIVSSLVVAQREPGNAPLLFLEEHLHVDITLRRRELDDAR